MPPSPPGWVLCSGLTINMCKTLSATQTPTRNLWDNSGLGEDESPAGDRMKLGGESWICLETYMPMAILLTRTTITFACYTWGQLERFAQDRDAWRALVGGLCSSRGQRQ